MASLNLSTNGPSISKSYQSVVNAPAPSGPAASSQTYGQWAVFSVSAPLVSTFQQDSAGKESVLKVQSSGEGELVDLIEEFSEGRVQFAYVKVKDPNTGLPKNVLIGWCGEGVPERTKGYFTSHLAAVSKLLHGYHVQITARSDRDLTPEGIVQKVADSSGSKYSAGDAAPAPAAPEPAVATKPVFTPSRTVGSFKPLAGNRQPAVAKDEKIDEDGWGKDAPPVTRTQLEKVQPAYKPTKVNMDDFRGQKSATTTSSSERREPASDDGVVKGDYQPVGKVDIAAIRRQARETGQGANDRPEPVKGSYEPVGKVDIAAIRAKAQGGQDGAQSPPTRVSPAATGGSGDQEEEAPKPLAERSSAFKPTERLTTLPKPKVSNKFGGGTSTFTGTKAPVPGDFEARPAQPSGTVGSASRTFADEGGKTPAQVWAEKKARERGGAPAPAPEEPQPLQSQESGQGGWRSSYTGKTWAPVQTTHTGASVPSAGAQEQDDQPPSPQEEEPQQRNMGAIKERFAQTAPMGAPAPAGYERAAPPPPPVEESTKPVISEEPPAPSLPIRSQPAEEAPQMPQRRSPTPEQTSPVDTGSPIRVAMPVGRGGPAEDEPPAPAAGHPETETVPHQEPVAAPSGGQGTQAVVLYDYERSADDELELRDGEYVTDIEKVDPDWWMGVNSRGEQGLFPSNYVEEVAGDSNAPAGHAGALEQQVALASATALYDYDAVEDNEIGFQEGAKITDIEFVGEDWWHGMFNGKHGLFPANYVQLDQ